MLRAALLIPALDESGSIGLVLDAVPRGLFAEIVVVDNGSRDGTAKVARERGARVVAEPLRGYGRACQAGLAALGPEMEAVAFVDADFSDDPGDLSRLLAQLEEHQCDLVIGSRVLGNKEPGSLTPLQRFGNWLATRLIRRLWGARFTDLGPMRAIRRSALVRLGLSDRDFGWNVEMQAKAAKSGLKVEEIPVSYRRRRHGHSKISRTLAGSLRAGAKILWTLLRCWLSPLPGKS